MKKLNIIFSGFLIFLLSVSDVTAQKLIKKPLFTGSTYASGKVNRIFIPPPPEYFRMTSKGAAKIDIYLNGFPLFAIDAVKHAVSILEAVLPPDVHITVNANWINIPTSGVLANSASTAYALGWGIDALEPMAIYPVALAEKIAGESLNEDAEGDIDLNINSSASWYYGIDGNTPTLKYDLVTVTLHEMLHGIGFFDSYYAESSTGSYGASGIPFIYDIFVENLAGKRLADTLLFENPSAELKAELTGGSLWFNGPVVRAATDNARVRLYAPSTYDPGSSIAHLDENTYTSAEALMTPFISRGEAIHNPGNLAMAMLGDMGWINTRIVHESPRDTEDNITSLEINTEIRSDTTYKRDEVILVWSYDNFSTSSSVAMEAVDSGNDYTATIPVSSYETRVDYFISVKDFFLRNYISPSDTAYPYSVFIGTDTVKPVILHTPEAYYLSVTDSIKFVAEAADNIEIDTVIIEYKINEGTSFFTGLSEAGEYNYMGGIDISSLSFSKGDSLKYRITAVDEAAAPNMRILPSSGYFSVPFEVINPVAESYTTDFSGAADDFINNGFEVTVPSGFSDFGLHTLHPYESPEESGDSIGYTALLRTPVRFDGNGMIISMDEVVLVEPGESGSLFGSIYFYDYVIVEGSPDYGKTWIKLADGYDSRHMDAWVKLYNSSIVDMNSTAEGDETMLVKHSIFPKVSDSFSDGDIMMVRFRLFSDPYANGWGWGIQNLHIGPLINSVTDTRYTMPVIYPNPGDGRFSIRFGEVKTSVRYDIINSTGKYLRSGFADGRDEMSVDISQFPSGLYMIVIYDGESVRTVRYNLIK